MIKYYKLKLDDSIFWQSKVNQGKLTYDKKTYVPKCMNYIFFKQETDGTYTEIFQGHKFIIKDDARIKRFGEVCEDAYS